MSDDPKPPIGLPLALDPKATSALPTEPAFIAPPAGAPAYYGFAVLDDVSIDGFVFGKITDFEAEPSDYGDAFVVAPDDSRAGLVWEISDSRYFTEVCPIEDRRWGVWAVSFQLPMSDRENARRNLESILPMLKQKWDEWRKDRDG
jgi:hypothetical protein